MSPEDYQALVEAHGGVQSQIATGPTEENDPEYEGTGVTIKRDIPAERRQQRVVFKDGTYITVQPQADGTFGIVQPLAKSAAASTSGNEPVTRTDGAGNLWAWDPKTNQWSQVSGSQAKLSPEEQAANVAKAQQDQAEREYNSTHPDESGKAYYLTHAELEALHQKQTAANLDAKQAEAQIANMEADNKRLDAQLAVSQTNASAAQTNANANAVSAQASLNNSQASLQNAETQSRAQQKQAEAEDAAAQLARDKLEWDKQYQAGQLSLADATEKYNEAHQRVVDLANQARLEFDKEAEANRKAEAARTATENERHNQAVETETSAARTAQTEAGNQDRAERAREADQTYAQRQAELEQTAEQQRQQLAERIGEAGAQALQASLPFMAPAGTSADLAGIRNGTLTNPQHPQAAPPARSIPFPYDPATIVQQLTAQALANLSPTAQAVSKKMGAAPPAPAMPVAPVQAPQVATPPGIQRPLLPPGAAGTAQDTGLGPTPPGAFPVTPAATPFAQSGLPEGRGTPVVNLHFYAPTGGPASRGSLDAVASGIDPVTGQPINPYAQGVTV